VAYDTQAQEFVYGFYARGWSKERALPEIRKVYAGFSGSTWDEWVKRYDWPQRRALADAKLRDFDDLCRTTAQTILLELNEIRERLLQEIRGGKADTQTVYAFSSVTKQITDIAAKQLQAQDPMKVAVEVLASAFERFLRELRAVDGLGPVLERRAGDVGALVAKVTEEFGREARA
jgi:hypothetical protein